MNATMRAERRASRPLPPEFGWLGSSTGHAFREDADGIPQHADEVDPGMTSGTLGLSYLPPPSSLSFQVDAAFWSNEWGRAGRAVVLALDRPFRIAVLASHEKGKSMIRVRLFDNKPDVKYVDFRCIPVCSEKDFRCQPEGLISLAIDPLVAKELDDGAVCGWIPGYQWYRQARAD